LCKKCGTTSLREYKTGKWQRDLFHDYVFGKQTLRQLADKYNKTTKTIQKYLDHYHKAQCTIQHIDSVVILIDCTFFGRGYGIVVARCPGSKRNLYWKEITTENKSVYQEARDYLEEAGFHIQAVVIDAKRGSKEVFSDLRVQICQHHQQQIITRYLTSSPKTQAARELKVISDLLPKTSASIFSALLLDWHKRWSVFLKERSYAPDMRHWWYTHKRLRSAYRSLYTNLPV
jgi:hypothetical protein